MSSHSSFDIRNWSFRPLVLVLSLLFFSLIFHLTSAISYAAITRITDSVKLSASIPVTSVTITGYTCPTCRVELSNSRIFAAAYSDSTGFFVFNKTVLPRLPGSLCLTSYDDYHRPSTPLCLPELPETNYHTDLGPILLPPILSINESSISPGQTVAASGKTIPLSTITIYLYQQSTPQLFPQAALAASLPKFTTQSDAAGNYSFSLPTVYATDYRLFATTTFDNDYPTPKSNTLVFRLPSLWSYYWSLYAFYIILIPLFVLSIGLFIYLTYRYYRLPRYLPAVYQKSLISV